MARKLLGEILVEEGLIRPEHLREALEEQRRQLGEILVQKGYLREEDLERALQIQFGQTRAQRYRMYLRTTLVLLFIFVVISVVGLAYWTRETRFLEDLESGTLSLGKIREIIAEGPTTYKMSAMKALGKYSPSEQAEILKLALQSPEWYVRLYAALYAFKHKPAAGDALVPYLIPLMSGSEEDIVRYAAHQALVKLTGTDAGDSFKAWFAWAKAHGRLPVFPAYLKKEETSAAYPTASFGK